jgi:hypothetical protein
VNLDGVAWPSVVISTIALVVSVVALLRTIARDRTAQAQQVSAWVTYYEADASEASTRAGAPCLVVANQSGQPIYDWHVEYYYRGEPIGRTRVRTTVPGGGRDVVPLNGETQATFRDRRGPDDEQPDRAFSDIVAAVAFRDHLGRRWRRDAAGRLSRDGR